jgi:hypothetical protein
MARPPKHKKFIEAAEELLETILSEVGTTDNYKAIIHTDSELLMLVNQKLEENDRITDSTFEAWKHGDITDNEALEKFSGLIKKAESIQKQSLFKELMDGGSGLWQKWAWILERKFPKWNLKKISEMDVTTKGEKLKQIFKIGDQEVEM